MHQAQLVRQPIEKEGLVGTLFYPQASGPHPALIFLGGADGGLPEGSAMALASEGFAALALAYFGTDSLPPELVEIPLEYFAEAIAWLKAQRVVNSDRIGLMGVSTGGELALLLGATYREDIKAVVGYVPSAVVYQGLSFGWPYWRPKSAWTLRGEPVPFVNASLQFSQVIKFFVGRSVSLRSAYERPLEDRAAVAAGSIAVENIDGPVLVISGTDDQVWPSTRLCEIVVDRLKRYAHPFPYEHLCYEGAGHISGPYYGAVATRAGATMLGGSLGENGFANVDSWVKTLSFLREYLEK